MPVGHIWLLRFSPPASTSASQRPYLSLGSLKVRTGRRPRLRGVHLGAATVAPPALSSGRLSAASLASKVTRKATPSQPAVRSTNRSDATRKGLHTADLHR